MKKEKILKKFGQNTEIYTFNDTVAVLERAWAQKCGLGFIGKSSMFIHRKFGTYTFLGGFVTNLNLLLDNNCEKNYCGSCNVCLINCPTGAIVESRKIDARRCLTTWNVERISSMKKKDHFKLKGYGWAFGCDICQEVCPWNKFKKKTMELRFQPNHNHVVLGLKSVPFNLCGTSFSRSKMDGLLKSIKLSF